MDSNYIKAVLSANFRFKKQTKVMATEVGYFNADFACIKKNLLTEIEIKISKQDLNNDFKKEKHKVFEQFKDANYQYFSDWIPNYFYFAVPEDLVEYAISKCMGKPYGVILIEDTKGSRLKRSVPCLDLEDVKRRKKRLLKISEKYNNDLVIHDVEENKYGSYTIHYSVLNSKPLADRVRVVKRAKKIHNKKATRKAMWQIIARLSSEMSNLRLDSARNNNK